MNNLDVSQMEEIAGGNKATAIIGCAASVVALEAAFIGLGALTGGVGDVVLALMGFDISLGALALACSSINFE